MNYECIVANDATTGKQHRNSWKKLSKKDVAIHFFFDDGSSREVQKENIK
jgi:hypothetical protein